MGDRWLRAVGASDDDGWPGGEPTVGDTCLCDDCLAMMVGTPLPDQHGGGGYGGGGGGGYGDDRGMITEVVLLDGHLIDVRTQPVGGSGYECAYHELRARGMLRPPRVIERRIREEPQEAMLDWLARLVGGEDALARLDGAPLPAGEELDLSAAPGWARERARVIDEQIQTAAVHRLCGPEVLTACRRLLVRAAGAGVLDIWGDLAPETVASAVVHCVIKANNLGAQSHGLPIKALLAGLTASYPSNRSRRIAEIVGGSSWPFGRRPTEAPDVYVLGDAGLLISDFRRDLLAYRRLAGSLDGGSV